MSWLKQLFKKESSTCSNASPKKNGDTNSCALRIQKLWRGYSARKRFVAYRQVRSHRINVVKELIATEKTYVNYLLIMERMYINRLKQLVAEGKPVLDSRSITDMFSVICDIINLNKALLAQLEGRLVENNLFFCMLGEVFVKMAPFFKVYSQYVSNYEKAMQIFYENRSKNSGFVAFLQDCLIYPETRGMDLPSLMVMPIQRPPRYVLLLSELVQHTPPFHPDYCYLSSALSNMREMAVYINEKKRDSESVVKSNEIFKRFSNRMDEIALPHRRLVREGTFKQQHGRASLSKICLVLFNDILVYGFVKLFSKIEVKQIVDLRSIVVREFPFDHDRNCLLHISSKDTDFNFIAESPEEKRQWMSDLKKTVTNLVDKETSRKSRFRKDENFGWKHKYFTGGFHSCCLLGDDKMLFYILDRAKETPHLFDINTLDEDGYSGLHLAAYGGHLAIVRLLIDFGVDVNIPDKSQRTALHIAVQYKQNYVIPLLLLKGADIEAKDYCSRTPLYVACMHQYKDEVEYLCASHANPDVVDDTGFYLLHACANMGFVDIVQILLKYTKNVDPLNDLKRTPLHYAISNRHTDVVRELLAAKCSLDVADEYGHRAIHFAVLSMDQEILSLIAAEGGCLDLSDPSDTQYFDKLPTELQSAYKETRAQFETARYQPPKEVKVSMFKSSLSVVFRTFRKKYVIFLLLGGMLPLLAFLFRNKLACITSIFPYNPYK